MELIYPSPIGNQYREGIKGSDESFFHGSHGRAQHIGQGGVPVQSTSDLVEERPIAKRVPSLVSYANSNLELARWDRLTVKETTYIYFTAVQSDS